MKRDTEPQVYVIGKTAPMFHELQRYLRFRDLPEWLSLWFERSEGGGRVDPGSLITEIYGRLCYAAWEPGYNPNVTKVRNSTRAYIGNLLAQKHGSVLEHTVYNFIFANVSRVFTHELVRHRVGTAISQESFRYVQLTRVDVNDPDPSVTLQGEDKLYYELNKFIALNIDALEGRSFEGKKRLTSKLRRWLPQGQATDIGWSCNLRELRHIIEARTSPGAEAEMRLVFDKVGSLMQSYEPLVFQDFTRSETGQWSPQHEKV